MLNIAYNNGKSYSSLNCRDNYPIIYYTNLTGHFHFLYLKKRSMNKMVSAMGWTLKRWREYCDDCDDCDDGDEDPSRIIIAQGSMKIEPVCKAP